MIISSNSTENTPSGPASGSDVLQRKTLLVSWGLPPALNGSSNIVANLAQQFSADEMVLAGEWSSGSDNEKWQPDDGPKIYYLHSRWPYRYRRVVRLFFFPLVLWRMWRAFRNERCEQILAIFPDEYYLFAALLVSKITGATFFSYFHNTYLENRFGWQRPFAKWLQREVFKISPIVFVMSDGMKECLERVYPSVRYESLVHSFNGTVDEIPAVRKNGNSLIVAYMGNLVKSNREAMTRIPNFIEKIPDCSFTVVSSMPESKYAELGICGARVSFLRVGNNSLLETLRENDFLFLPHGFTGGLSDIEYQTIFPTRTIPYLLSGVPIIAHSPKDCFLTRWLRKYDCAEIVDEPSADALVACVERLRQDSARRYELATNALEAVKQFQAANVARQLRDWLNQSVETKNNLPENSISLKSY